MRTSSPRIRRLGVGALLALAPLQVLALAVGEAPADGPAPRSAPSELRVGTAAPRPEPAVPEAAGQPVVGESAAAATVPALVTESDDPPAAAPRAATTRAAAASAGPATFADRHPAQVSAVQDPRRPETTRWALLIGINEHLGRVGDNVGSRQDAEDLRQVLLANGWRDDHILLLTDTDATRAAIVEGIAWLASKTDRDSVAVFHYSGHSKKWYGQDHDGDGEVTDEGLWPTDDRFIPDSELVALMDGVAPHALWMSFATCNAAGFADPGLARPGRVLTFSSGEPQKSYEHPGWQNSVWGWWLVDQGMAGGRGDLDGDGRVTVEEAWAWARPRASEYTRGQSHGPQDAVMVDLVDGDFDLVIPGIAPARPGAATAEQPPTAPPAGDAPAPQQPAPEQPAPEQPAPDEPERDGLCLLCGG
ncbi:MAG TPA: caspase family protein [Acidimicrobiales bacterium]|nr:caspase family protein [Acidimicrobiales bacterium]